MECDYPNCPSGASMKLLDDRHEEVKSHLSNIESNQKEMIVVVTNVATLLANVQNITKDMEQNVKDHDEIFTRLRKVESKIMWLSGGIAGIVLVIEILRLTGVVK